MARISVLVVAFVCYAAFFVSFVYLVGFVGGFTFMPTHVDKGLAGSPIVSLVVDLGVIALFGIQHSVMARPAFKERWTRIVPKPMERSIYCLATALVLGVVFALWHPIEGSLWSVENPAIGTTLWALFWIGWGTVFVSTWLLNHFELFGLQQAWNYARGREQTTMEMRTPLLYKLVRHPIYMGFFIALWATPHMTYSHALLAAGLTVYIMIGIAHEERDLTALYGDEYVTYSKRTGAFLPGIGKKA